MFDKKKGLYSYRHTLMVKHLFKGHFERGADVLILRTQAVAEDRAWMNFMHQIANRDGIHVSHVMRMFPKANKGVNFNIEKEIEFTEVEE